MIDRSIDSTDRRRECLAARKVLSSMLDEICRGYGEDGVPAEAILLTSQQLCNRLLAVRRDFLELGQNLPWPGLPLLGATFGPDWGFSAMTIDPLEQSSLGFALPTLDFHELAEGDIHGFRVCMLEDSEVPEALLQLAKIRGKFQAGELALYQPVAEKIKITAQRV